MPEQKSAQYLPLNGEVGRDRSLNFGFSFFTRTDFDSSISRTPMRGLNKGDGLEWRVLCSGGSEPTQK